MYCNSMACVGRGVWGKVVANGGGGGERFSVKPFAHCGLEKV